MWQSVKSYLLSISVAYVLGSIFATQFTLSNLSDFSFQISLSDRLFATGQDIISLAGSYLPLIALALLISFVFASFVNRFGVLTRLYLFAAAGFFALVCLHLIMKAVLGLTGIAATRTISGLLSQGVAGAVGGMCYAYLSGAEK